MNVIVANEKKQELSMTAIAVVAIAAIGVLFYNFVWPSIQSNIKRSANCAQAYDCDCGANGTDKTCKCTYVLEDGTNTSTVMCPNQNGS